MGIKHAYQTATADDPGSEVSASEWNADHSITGEVTFPLVSTPATPAADNINVFGHKVGGRMMLGMEGPSGLDTPLQPFIGRNAVAVWLAAAGGSSTPSAWGIPTATATGTATAATTTTGGRYLRMKKTEYLVTTASTTAVAGFRAQAAQWSVGGEASGDGGFLFVCRWAPATGVATTTTRAFVGLGPTAAPTDVEPSSITSQIGMGWDAADTNIQIITRGSGAVLKTDTGIPVPTSDRSAVYEIAMFSPPGTTQILGVQVRNLVSGDSFYADITTNLPPVTQLLAPRGWMSVGGTSSVIGIALMSMYIETDY